MPLQRWRKPRSCDGHPRPGPADRATPREHGLGGTRPVADAAHGDDDLGVLRVVLDLRTQALDVDIDQTRVAGVPITPHLLEQHLTGEHLPRLACEGNEEVELQRGQRQWLALAFDRMAGHVDMQVADLELLRLRFVTATQSGTHAGYELLGLERLQDIVVSAGLESDHDVDGVGARRQHDDRNTGLGTDPATHLDAVDPGQHEIQQHDVRATLAKQRHRRGSVGAVHDVQALVAQDDAQHLGQRQIVIHDEYATLHTPVLSDSCIGPRACGPESIVSCTTHRARRYALAAARLTARGGSGRPGYWPSTRSRLLGC